MMRSILIGSLVVIGLIISGVLAEERKYTTKYDNINVDAIINSERLLSGYVNCLLDLGPCTSDAAELKNNLPDALENDCSRCSEVQKNAADKVCQHLIDHKPEDWSLLEEKYDPTGAYRKRYLEKKSKEASAD